MIKLGTNEIQYIAIFESITGATAKDCLIDVDNGRITFVVKEGHAGAAIGKGGTKIKHVRNVVGKNIEVIEYSKIAEKFISNILMPVVPKNIRINDSDTKKVAIITITDKDKGIAIGKNGKNIDKIKTLVKRHYEIDGIKIV